MSQVNYDAMSKTQLKQYFLKHRGDRSTMPRILRQNQSVVRSELSRFLTILILTRKSKQRFAKNSKIIQLAIAFSPSLQHLHRQSLNIRAG